MTMRRFHLNRIEDESGVSGIGKVAEGVLFNGTFYIVSWISLHRSLTTYLSLAELQAVHGHSGKTELLWIDSDPELPSEKQSGIVEAKDATVNLSVGNPQPLKTFTVTNHTSKGSLSIPEVTDQLVDTEDNSLLSTEAQIEALTSKSNPAKKIVIAKPKKVNVLNNKEVVEIIPDELMETINESLVEKLGDKGVDALNQYVGQILKNKQVEDRRIFIDGVEDEVIERLKSLGDNGLQQPVAATNWYDEMPDK